MNVNLSSLVSGPCQKAPFEQFGGAHDSTIGCDWMIDRKSECGPAPFAFHQPADQICDQIALLAGSAEQQLNRETAHQSAGIFAKVEGLTSWPRCHLRFREPSHAFWQFIDTSLAQWGCQELTVMRMSVASRAREARAQSPRCRVSRSTGQ